VLVSPPPAQLSKSFLRRFFSKDGSFLLNKKPAFRRVGGLFIER
jgi:GT2 family glycosyltransferase